MTHWIPVAAESECPPGAAVERVVAGRIVALFNVDGRFFALDGVCPHQGGPLGKGRLCGQVVTCPWHGWQFDVTDGQHQFSPTVRQPGFAVRAEQGQVYIQLDAAEGGGG